MAKFDYGIATKGVKYAGDLFAASENEKAKMLGKLLSSKITAKQKWFRKLQLQELQQAQLKELYKQQQAGGSVLETLDDPAGTGLEGRNALPGGQPYPGGQGPAAAKTTVKDPFDVTTTPPPKVRYGKKGLLETYSPSVKEQIFDRIEAKRARQMPLTQKEVDFEEEFLGLKKKSGVWKKSGLSDYKRNQILGNIQVPIKDEEGVDIPETQESASDYLLTQGYLNYQEDEEIMDFIATLPSENPGIAQYKHDSNFYRQKPKKFEEAVSNYGVGTTDTVVGIIQGELKKRTKEEIKKLLIDKDYDPELFKEAFNE
tara:strand:- start:2234 stop:3175 length:942 start_codon:yes stop_codon:yes gene_type:complete